LGVVVVEKASGYPSGDLTKAYEGFPLFTAPTIPAAVQCPECVQLCDNVVKGTITVTPGGTTAIAGALVELMASGTRSVAWTFTDSAGYYEFNDVPAGSYKIKASKTGYITKLSTAFTVACPDSDTVNLSLPTCTGEPFTINGKATLSGSGAALRGATVELWKTGGTSAYKSATTNSEGDYKFLSVPCGNYHLKILFVCNANTVSRYSEDRTFQAAATVNITVDPADGSCAVLWPGLPTAYFPD